MDIKKFVEKYDKKVITDLGTTVSRSFLICSKNWNETLASICEKIGAQNVKYHTGFYEVSNFIKKDNQFFYIMWDCPRNDKKIDLNSKEVGKGGFLVRLAASEKDYGGGSNNFCTIFQIESTIDRLLTWSKSHKF